LERTIQGLEQEKEKLTVQVSKGLTPEQEERILDFASQLAVGLSLADDQFQSRRQIVDLLDVSAVLTREDGKKVAYVSCVLGENVFGLDNKKGNGHGSGGENSQVAFNNSGAAGSGRSRLKRGELPRDRPRSARL
jgi:hypothetical protein